LATRPLSNRPDRASKSVKKRHFEANFGQFSGADHVFAYTIKRGNAMDNITGSAPTLDDLRARRDEIIAIADKHGAFNVRVFGSIARGEATPESDVDILVATRDGVSMFDLVGLWLDLQDLLGREVSLITDNDDPNRERFMKRVRKDAMPL
jgi:predicted nucleotidyltransferase